MKGGVYRMLTVNFKGHGITAVDCGAFLILTALQGQEGCHGQPGEKAV